MTKTESPSTGHKLRTALEQDKSRRSDHAGGTGGKDMLKTVLKAVSLIVVAVPALVADVEVAQASDNQGEQGELNDIRTQECSNEQTDAWGDASPQQLRGENCQQ